MPRAEASHLALQTSSSQRKKAAPDTAQRAVCRSAARDTSMQDGGGGPCAETLLRRCDPELCAARLRLAQDNPTPAPPPAAGNPIKQPRPRLVGGACALERERAPLYSWIQERSFSLLLNQLGLVLLAPATPGRRNLVGDRLGGSGTCL